MEISNDPNKWMYDIEDVDWSEDLSDYWKSIFKEIPEQKDNDEEKGPKKDSQKK